MKRPNFFILGAPKCGTTSLATWLAAHPQVFFSQVKEPHFFNFDYAARSFRSLSQYERLFSAAKECHIAVGEASVGYLYSRTAVPAIIEYAKRPRFIVMVRNPVNMAYSLHEQTFFNGDEDESDFLLAWQLQAVRVYGDRIPKACLDPQLLLYGRLCQVGVQIKRLFEIVPHKHVLIVNLESIKRDARQEYQRVLEFLGLEDDYRQDFPVSNTAKERRYPTVWQAIRWTNRVLQSAGIPHIRLGLTQFLSDRDRKERPRPPMSDTVQSRLREYFLDDITLLERLTGWDLKHWKSSARED